MSTRSRVNFADSIKQKEDADLIVRANEALQRSQFLLGNSSHFVNSQNNQLLQEQLQVNQNLKTSINAVRQAAAEQQAAFINTEQGKEFQQVQNQILDTYIEEKEKQMLHLLQQKYKIDDIPSHSGAADRLINVAQSMNVIKNYNQVLGLDDLIMTASRIKSQQSMINFENQTFQGLKSGVFDQFSDPQQVAVENERLRGKLVEMQHACNDQNRTIETLKKQISVVQEDLQNSQSYYQQVEAKIRAAKQGFEEVLAK